jgi:LPS sulfotransferase NodH
MTGKQTIVICAINRSGSTLVCEDLRNNDLGLTEEYVARFVKKDPPDGFDLAAYLRQRGTDAGGFCSLKIMANYAGRLDEYLRNAKGEAPQSFWSSLASERSGSRAGS